MSRSSRNLTFVGISFLALVFITGLILVTRTVLEDGVAGRPLDNARPTPREVKKDLTPLAELAVRPGGLVDLKMQMFRRHMGRYPATLDELSQAPQSLSAGERWEGPYVSSQDVLLDPWGTRYEYNAGGEGGYELWSCGPDGVSGTGDDVHN